MPPPARWLARENKWRAMRYGLDADLLISPQGEIKPIKKDIEDWLYKTAKYREALGYGDYVHTLRQIIAHGNSSQRQLIIWENTGSLQEVVKYNIQEFEHRSPLWKRDINNNHEVIANKTIARPDLQLAGAE